MKKRSVAVLSVTLCIACMLTGCSSSSENDNKSIPEKVLLSELDITDEIVKESVKGIDNINASEEMRILVPNNADKIYSYTSHPVRDVNIKDYYDDFISLYQYLFPDHKMNENYLFYLGGSSSIEYDDEGNKIQDLNLVKDYYNDIMSGREGEVYFLYDETWYRNLTEWNDPVCLEICNPMGYGYAIISKGKTTKITGKITDIITDEKNILVLKALILLIICSQSLLLLRKAQRATGLSTKKCQ